MLNCPHCGKPMPEEALFCESCGKERQLVPEFEAEINESMDEAISNIAVQLANTQEIKPQELARDQQIRQQIFEEKANAGELNKKGDPEKESAAQTGASDEETKDGGRDEAADAPSTAQSDGRNSRDKTSDVRKPDRKRSGSRTEVSRIGGIRLPFVLLIASLVVVLMLTGIMSYVLRKNQTSTYEYQIRQAKMYEQQKDYEQMLIYARKATDIAANSSDAKMLVARAYEGLGKTDEEKIVLEGLLITDPAFSEAYSALIPMYEAEGEYEKIAQLLAGCPDQATIGKYSGYLASPPEFSVQGGEYSEPVSLKLLASGAGTIYYTVDGSEPTPQSPVYTMPILLDSGKIKVRAIYENNLGIVSRESSAEYRIEIDEAQAQETAVPEVLLAPGTYTNPQVVAIAAPPEGYQAYYTDDGSAPGLESRKYAKPIPLPIGASDFQFVLFDEEGNASETVSCHYQFSIDLPLTHAQARNLLMQALVGAGVLADSQGNIPGGGGVKDYQIISVIENGGENFYLIEEYFHPEDGGTQRTGNFYAVNPTTGQSYAASEDDNGVFHLSGL